MKLPALGRRTFAAVLLASVCFTFASQTALSQSIPIASNAVTIDPPVPTPAGTPCVVNLVQYVDVFENPDEDPFFQTNYTYSPSASCPGPWAKVVLKVNVQEDNYWSDATKAYIRLGGVQLYEGSMSNLPPHTNTAPAGASWEVERDVTDLSSLFTTAQAGIINLIPEQNSSYWWNFQNVDIYITAQLLFYPASNANPAQQIPDAVYGILPNANTVSLPHNIVRAYLDVYNQEAWWFTCVPDKDLANFQALTSPIAMGGATKVGIYPPGEGCGGGSFAEIGVNIDGTPAGLAPVFPLLSSTYNFAFFNAINDPVQPPQMLNYIPYRVDLSPFAAILNAPGTHTIALSRGDAATLLVYEDKGSTTVTGAVTLNTLAGSTSTPTVTDTLQAAGDSASGQIATGLDRSFTIQGFVNTSSGRVDSIVQQTSHFQNTQDFYLDGLQYPNFREYRQHVQLASQTKQHSRRVSAGAVLNDDATSASYPLDLLYDMTGYTFEGDGEENYPLQGTVSVTQHRNLDAAHVKQGFAPYASTVRDNFVSSSTFNTTTEQTTNWQAQADYRFYDSKLSCYQKAVNALNGVVATETDGNGCPLGQNEVRWFAHPDGSPDGLGWAH